MASLYRIQNSTLSQGTGVGSKLRARLFVCEFVGGGDKKDLMPQLSMSLQYCPTLT